MIDFVLRRGRGGIAGAFATARSFFQAISLLLERYQYVSIFDAISGGSNGKG